MQTHTRRTVLGASIVAAGSGVLAACSGSAPHPESGSHPAGSPHARPAPYPAPGSGPGSGTAGHHRRAFVPRGPEGYVNPSDPEVIAAEQERGSGPLRRFRFTAGETFLDLGGPTVRSWAYDDRLPGRE